MCDYKGHGQIFEIGSGEAIEKWEVEGTSQQIPAAILWSSSPPKLDKSIVCLIPKTARSYDWFLSKLQQFSMDAMGPLIYLQEQMEAQGS